MDNSKEGLMFKNRKSFLASSFDSISEKQEEASEESNHKKKENKTKIKPKLSTKNMNQSFQRNILEDADIVPHLKNNKNKKSWVHPHQKFSIFQTKEENPFKENTKMEDVKSRGSVLKTYKRKQSKKKINKRNSMQDNGPMLSNIALVQLNESSALNKVNKSNISNINSPNPNSRSLINTDNSYTRRISHSKSSVFEIQYKKMKKNTALKKGTLDFNDKAQISIFDQIKNSDLYEKTEILLAKIKLFYGILAIFSLLCIILNIADTILYNNKSLEYLTKNNNNNFTFNKTIIESYYSINKRKISSRENSLRIFNGIFSFICFVILIMIYMLTNGILENNRKTTKRERFNRMLDQYYMKQRKKSVARNKFNEEGVKDKNLNAEKVKVINLNQNIERDDFSNDSSIQKNRIRIIRNCIINLIFYPPIINKSFIGKYNNIIYIYSLNSIFLIISLYKITNIYRAIFYLSPLNNAFNKAICKSNLVNLNSRFMFKYSLNKFPLSFLVFNIIIILVTVCIVITCVEFFSLDIRDDFWNNIMENKMENVFNIFNAFFFFIIKNMHEEHSIKSVLGKSCLFLGGIAGLLISSYFIYFLNNLIKFNPEEHDAFLKLTKLLNPTNKEHKAANLIKSLLFTKKIIIDNQNNVKEYKNKMEELKRPTHRQRKPIFQRDNNFNFAFNKNSNTNLMAYNESQENAEKKKYIRYIGAMFFLRIKFVMECQNFSDDLKVARNSSLSFNDVLKTIGHKMDENMTQLNNKIEVLIKNDQKYFDQVKVTSDIIKSLRKTKEYHKSLIQYFVDIHNEYLKQMIELKKEAENNSPYLYKDKFPRKIKSNMYGQFNFKKRVKSKIIGNNIGNSSKKKSKRDLFELNKPKVNIKKQRSTQTFGNYLQHAFKETMKKEKSNQNTKSTNKTKKTKSTTNKRTKSLDDWKFIGGDLKDKLNIQRKSVINQGKRCSSVIGK